MGGEKQGSKDGGYVGGFLHLFDWKAKSRKKLFSNKSDLPEQSKQKKRRDGNLPTTRVNPMDEDELAAGSSIKGSSDYSCASSVTDEEGCGPRAPGVVARLMGLDSLPISNLAEPFSTPFFDSHSLGDDAQCLQRNVECHHDHQTMHSGGSHNEMEAPFQKVIQPKPQKMISRPFEKFQTETLPPKSAKSIPITHHKLLSPIKTPGFIPSKNAAHIMEAAAKIIGPGSQASKKAKMSLLGTSSVPLKVRDLREKVEAAQKSSRAAEASSSRKPVETNAAKFLKGESVNKSWNGSEDTSSFRVPSDSGDSSGVKDKGKSVSLALQAKVNVQRREGLSSSASRSKFRQEGQSDVMPRPPFEFRPNSQKKSTQKKPSVPIASGVLRQNNEKQNCLVDKEKLPSKPLQNSHGRKVLSRDSSTGVHKVGSRKLSPEVTDSKRESPYSRTKNVPRKKRYIDGSFELDKDQVVDGKLVCKTEKPPIPSNSVINRHFTWAEDSKREGLDVVSFTFTTPLTRTLPGAEISRNMSEKNNGFCADYGGEKLLVNSDSVNSGKLSARGCNVTRADDLSILLEQKLRELTRGVESSRYRVGMAGNSASIFQDLLPTTPILHDKKTHDGMQREKLSGQCGSNFSSTELLGLMSKHKLQGPIEVDECDSDETQTRKFLKCRHPSPISVLEPSFLTESYNSSDSADSYSIEGGKQCSSVQAVEVLGTSSLKKIHLVETDTELSDSASSTSTRPVAGRSETALSTSYFVGSSTRWELEYVKEILLNVESMFKDFALGQASEIVNPRLFDLLENRKEGLEREGEEPKLRRKVLFDCVGECVDLRCRTWEKGLSTIRRKEQLGEEVHKEISGWRGLGDCMVDDLVDKDMSRGYGKWLDFEVEAFELGVRIEGRILNSLVDELVADILLL